MPKPGFSKYWNNFSSKTSIFTIRLLSWSISCTIVQTYSTILYLYSKDETSISTRRTFVIWKDNPYSEVTLKDFLKGKYTVVSFQLVTRRVRLELDEICYFFSVVCKSSKAGLIVSIIIHYKTAFKCSDLCIENINMEENVTINQFNGFSFKMLTQ